MKGCGSRASGFTLMELMVVVALVATLSLVAMPRFKEFLVPDPEQGVQRELENLLMAVREESVLGRYPMAVVYSLSEGTYRSAVLGAEGGMDWESDPLSIRRRLPAGMKFLDVSTPREERAASGAVFTLIWPTGWIEPTILHLQDERGRQYTLLVEPLSGAVRLAEGYLVQRRISS
jgi:prepilin-type N-terminal cleavage/methylation domain-containing protein